MESLGSPFSRENILPYNESILKEDGQMLELAIAVGIIYLIWKNVKAHKA